MCICIAFGNIRKIFSELFYVSFCMHFVGKNIKKIFLMSIYWKIHAKNQQSPQMYLNEWILSKYFKTRSTLNILE